MESCDFRVRSSGRVGSRHIKQILILSLSKDEDFQR